MRRLKDYLSFAAWQSGLSYIALWAVTFWSLDWGPIVFGRTDACHVDSAKVMFYWVCDPTSSLAILAAVANTALTVTVWAPVYVAAATVQPEAIAIAVPILAAHLIGLPMAILVMIRLMLLFSAAFKKRCRVSAGTAGQCRGGRHHCRRCSRRFRCAGAAQTAARGAATGSGARIFGLRGGRQT